MSPEKLASSETPRFSASARAGMQRIDDLFSKRHGANGGRISVSPAATLAEDASPELRRRCARSPTNTTSHYHPSHAKRATSRLRPGALSRCAAGRVPRSCRASSAPACSPHTAATWTPQRSRLGRNKAIVRTRPRWPCQSRRHSADSHPARRVSDCPQDRQQHERHLRSHARRVDDGKA